VTAMPNTSRHPRRLRRLLLLLPAAALSDTDASCIDSGDLADHCPLWAQRGECATNPVYMHEHCRRSCGCPAQGPPPPSGECADRDKSGACATWAAAGECDANPAYMKVKCASTCGTCDMLDWRKRCPVDPEAKPAVPPGAMQETFERALSNFPQYSPQLLSSDPYVVTFEDFISDDEVEALLRHSEGRFVRSTASGGRNADADEFIPLTSEIRTSWTTWCDTAACLADPHVVALSRRMAELTRMPSTNYSEFIQLLRYMPCASPTAPDCQFYRRHHDTIPELATMPCGPRVYTFFLYLSDVEQGGGTKFDGGFTVQPKKGRAVLWPATFNERPFEKDARTHHEALPVLKGIKYAANFWLHQYDYVDAHHRGCTA